SLKTSIKTITNLSDTNCLEIQGASLLAIDWIGDSNLKAELFADSFDRVFTESEIVSKTRKAIQEATEALALFDTIAEQAS
ncbi:DUF2560 family protein, partial [Klebsiella pneumoniae]